MFLEMMKMALESLWAKKTRTVLSMLGIIIGVATVIAVFAIGEGAKKSVSDQFQNLSANSLLLMSTRGREAISSSKLTASDAEIIAESASNVKSASGAIQSNFSVSYGSVDESYGVLGVDQNFISISNLVLSIGRVISQEDIDNKEMIAILGATTASTLFEDGIDPIGEIISVGNKKLEVIGVLESLGSRIGMLSVDDSVIIPYSTAEKSLMGTQGQVIINVLIDDIDRTGVATSSITTLLRNEHNLKIDQEDDFKIMDAGSMIAAAQESAKTMSLLLTAIAAITLLVSGIGIMNVMFVTVAERTKEIGISKAIGGKQSDILTQFLLESVILSMMGGAIGIIIGLSAIPIMTRFNVITMISSSTGPILGFSFAVTVGIIFGFYPAYKASRLDPVDALRSE